MSFSKFFTSPLAPICYRSCTLQPKIEAHWKIFSQLKFLTIHNFKNFLNFLNPTANVLAITSLGLKTQESKNYYFIISLHWQSKESSNNAELTQRMELLGNYKRVEEKLILAQSRRRKIILGGWTRKEQMNVCIGWECLLPSQPLLVGEIGSELTVHYNVLERMTDN